MYTYIFFTVYVYIPDRTDLISNLINNKLTIKQNALVQNFILLILALLNYFVFHQNT